MMNFIKIWFLPVGLWAITSRTGDTVPNRQSEKKRRDFMTLFRHPLSFPPLSIKRFLSRGFLIL